jgi:hypothetical protein
MDSLRVSRRNVLLSGVAGTLGAMLVPEKVFGADPVLAPTPAKSGALHNEGCGMYTDPSVAQQCSTFAINPRNVTCGVGTLAQGQQSGPFAMLMYSLRIDSYAAEPRVSTIRATGLMRSITRMGGQTIEDVVHEFVAAAVASIGSGPGRYDLHFVTPFWNPSNPLATRSTLVDGWVRFGGDVLMGEVVVGP